MTPPKNHLFLGHPPDSTTHSWQEWHIQAYIVQEARRAGYTVSGSMEQAKRNHANAGRAKATGLTAGEPDLRFYLGHGRFVMIELKTMKGVISPAQEAYHEKLLDLGHCVRVVWAESPADGWKQVLEILHDESKDDE